MTSSGPYTESIIPYEPSSHYFLGVAVTPYSALDFLRQKMHTYYRLVCKAKMESLYNNPSRNYTFLISEISDNILENISSDLARKILKKSTLSGIITTKMINNEMVLSTNNDYEKLRVSVYQPLTTNIQKPYKTCEFSAQQSNFPTCNNYHIECKLNQCNISNRDTHIKSCDYTSTQMYPLIQIDGITLIKGDILVNGGIIHILEKPLWPTI